VLISKGKLEFPSGASYDGLWRDNQYSGVGTFAWPDSSSFTGEWETNAISGSGKFIDMQGESWSGNVAKFGSSILTPGKFYYYLNFRFINKCILFYVFSP
jgi:hypothetical protein